MLNFLSKGLLIIYICIIPSLFLSKIAGVLNIARLDKYIYTWFECIYISFSHPNNLFVETLCLVFKIKCKIPFHMFNGVITGRPLQLHILPRLNNRCHRSLQCRQFHHRRLPRVRQLSMSVLLSWMKVHWRVWRV